MALFRRGKSKKAKSGKTPLTPRRAYCRICEAERKMTQCWRRLGPVETCEACDTAFEDPAALYEKFQPACPQCDEFLEQPGFEYGLCDECGSKFELVEGMTANLLPNRAQRERMNQHGRARRPGDGG